jgi:hypothetical protein
MGSLKEKGGKNMYNATLIRRKHGYLKSNKDNYQKQRDVI